MFCKCYSPNKKKRVSKPVILHLEGKDIDLGEVTVEYCNNPYCKEGYIHPDRWKEIYQQVQEEGIDISQVALSRVLFAHFR